MSQATARQNMLLDEIIKRGRGAGLPGVEWRPIVAKRKKSLSESDEYRSPTKIVDRSAERYGPFDLDVAAAKWNRQAPDFYDKRRNGLLRPWYGRCWMNPPYSRGNLLIWMRRARGQVLIASAFSVTCLVPAYTCEGWWHETVEAPAGQLLSVDYRIDELGAVVTTRWEQLTVERTFLRGRQRFTEQHGHSKHTARYSSALVHFQIPR